jgi:hypothetical protein
MVVFAIDPGNEKSAFVIYSDEEKKILEKEILANDEILSRIDKLIDCSSPLSGDPVFVIEMIASYGMPVGSTVFETCVWVGRFTQKIMDIGGEVNLVYRKDIKIHLCGTTRAKDSNVRKALIDRFSSSGNNPVELHGVVKDMWAALACAVTYCDIEKTLTRSGDIGFLIDRKEKRRGKEFRANY